MGNSVHKFYLIGVVLLASYYNKSFADLKEDFNLFESTDISAAIMPSRSGCADDKKSSPFYKYCPKVLTDQVTDSYNGGIWGLVVNSKIDGVDSPAALCTGEIQGPIYENFTPKDYEKFLAQQKFSAHYYSLSEMYPYCVDQFNGTPDEKIKQKLMISNFFMGHTLIADEEENLLKGIAGSDFFLA